MWHNIVNRGTTGHNKKDLPQICISKFAIGIFFLSFVLKKYAFESFSFFIEIQIFNEC